MSKRRKDTGGRIHCGGLARYRNLRLVRAVGATAAIGVLLPVCPVTGGQPAVFTSALNRKTVEKPALQVETYLLASSGSIDDKRRSPRTVTIPRSIIGAKPLAAASILERLGLRSRAHGTERSRKIKSGYVVAVSPPTGTKVEPGTTVTLILAVAPAPRLAVVVPPRIIGQTLGFAEGFLTADHLTPGLGSGFPSSDIPVGVVISTSPSVGTKVTVGKKVILNYATSATTGTTTTTVLNGVNTDVTVPTGIIDEQAPLVESVLSLAGLKYTVGTYVYTLDVQPQDVVSTDPAPGTSVLVGSTVVIHVAAVPPGTVSGAELVIIPPAIVGQPIATAEAALTGLGLEYTLGPSQTSATVPPGDLVATWPPDGSGLTRGSIVILYPAATSTAVTTTAATTTSAPTTTSAITTTTVTRTTVPVKVAIPRVSRLPIRRAASILASVGLKYNIGTIRTSASVAAGDVLSTFPPSGTRVVRGSTVVLNIATVPVARP